MWRLSANPASTETIQLPACENSSPSTCHAPSAPWVAAKVVGRLPAAGAVTENCTARAGSGSESSFQRCTVACARPARPGFDHDIGHALFGVDMDERRIVRNGAAFGRRLMVRVFVIPMLMRRVDGRRLGAEHGDQADDGRAADRLDHGVAAQLRERRA